MVSASTAVYLGYTPPVGCGGVEMIMASQGGTVLGPELNVPLNTVASAAFISSQVGWVAGAGFTPPGTGGCGLSTSEILTTVDGGNAWSEQYAG